MVCACVNVSVAVSWEAILPRSLVLHPIRRDGDGGFFYAYDSVCDSVTLVCASEQEAANGRNS